MKLIIGLGNPGILYSGTRHNIGFSVLKALSLRHKAALKRNSSFLSLSAKVKMAGQEAILAMPLTYMNLSGNALRALTEKFGIAKDDLLVICDDLDLDFGRLKLKPDGSSGGHKGLASIIGCLGGDSFTRLRVGIGRPQKKEASDYVLSRFNPSEKKQLPRIVNDAADCCEMWISQGAAAAMNIFNKKE